MDNTIRNCSADEALQKLINGNQMYLAQNKNTGDISDKIRMTTHDEGQHPYAIIVGCSDSRAIPEVIFNAGIGDLFVIRVAGNVIDRHQLGSIEYIGYLVKEIRTAIGNETNEFRACCLNARHSVRMIEENADIMHLKEERGLKIISAIYHIDSGKVDFERE